MHAPSNPFPRVVKWAVLGLEMIRDRRGSRASDRGRQRHHRRRGNVKFHHHANGYVQKPLRKPPWLRFHVSSDRLYEEYSVAGLLPKK